MSLGAVILCLCGSSVWIRCCVLRGIWMPHFTLMLSLFFRHFCFSHWRKMALWSVSRSITDKTLLSWNFSAWSTVSLSSLPLHILAVMTEAWLDFQHHNARLHENWQRRWKLKLNNLGATSGKIPKAELQVRSRSLRFFHSGWDTVPDLFLLSKFYPFVLIIPSAIDMTHLDTLVTSLQPLRPALCVTQRTEWSNASRVSWSLNHIPDWTYLHHWYLLRFSGFLWECLFIVWDFFIGHYVKKKKVLLLHVCSMTKLVQIHNFTVTNTSFPSKITRKLW